MIPHGGRRPSAILSVAVVVLLLCPLSLRAQDFGTTMAAPMGQLPQVAIGQQFGPDGQPINPDSSDYQSPDDSNGDSNASSDDNDDNSEDNADSDNNSDSDDSNNDNAQSGNDDNSGQTQQPESN